ncbi:hypothetical protein DEA8626_03533 [Defluviimonas aquaemixtae]|uniref:Alpha/beta hydrolase fold-3 domain-containing protein n=1 Tax=Albidovulum aquaemixtae TaxID=1542388 RepID=A0A2R8BMA4_9RHOB|nr:alpha/beta hydrolase [Defluviimonas aquaemixtae]SPH24481.1 hypothetical protein DEA8626_03533 [Defluviimonas aquaemixtae]
MRYDEAFENAKHIPGGAGYPPRWAAKAAEFRDSLGDRARLGLSYGGSGANWFDLFLPADVPEGLLVFIHGGYWLRFGPRDFSHLAQGALAHGWAVAMPAYTLAPAAKISAMTAEIAAALGVVATEVAGPIVVAGHSAGGHLAARIACLGLKLPGDVAEHLRRVAPISPLSDLRPLMETTMNDELRLDAAEARAESPALLARRPGLPVHIWVGGDERPVFLDQARRLGNAWACPVTIDPGKHHFDVIEGLEDAASPLLSALLG